MLDNKKFKVEVQNLPSYPLRDYTVARYDEHTKKLWFYGTYNTEEEANNVANQLVNGIVVET